MLRTISLYSLKLVTVRLWMSSVLVKGATTRGGHRIPLFDIASSSIQASSRHQKLVLHISMLNPNRAVAEKFGHAVQEETSLKVVGKQSTQLQATRQMLRSGMPLPLVKQTLEAGASILCCRSTKVRDIRHTRRHPMHHNLRQAGMTVRSSWNMRTMAVSGIFSSMASNSCHRVKVWGGQQSMQQATMTLPAACSRPLLYMRSPETWPRLGSDKQAGRQLQSPQQCQMRQRGGSTESRVHPMSPILSMRGWKQSTSMALTVLIPQQS